MRSFMAFVGLNVAFLASAQTAPAAPVTKPPVAPAAPVTKPAAITNTKPTISGVTSKATSALAIELGSVVKGRIITCPAPFRLSSGAICLYSKASNAALRPLIKDKLGKQAIGDWKVINNGKTATLLVTPLDAKANTIPSYVLLTSLNDTITVVSIDALPAKLVTSTGRLLPVGVVKSEPYVLDSDLVGLVTVSNLGKGRYRLVIPSQPILTVTVGKTEATLNSGIIKLPLAPGTDGKNLLFPVADLSALGCTVSPLGKSFKIACGSASLTMKPIVF